MSHEPTLNQALLGLVLEEGAIRAAERRVQLDLTRLQLVVYFLLRLGTPLTYIFDLRYSGPHSTLLAKDVETLTKAGLIHHLPVAPGRFATFTPIEPLARLWGRHAERIEGERFRVCQNLAAFLPLDLEDLRLLASIDSVHRALRAAVPPDRLEGEVLETLRGVSRGRYARPRMAETYGHYAQSLLATA